MGHIVNPEAPSTEMAQSYLGNSLWVVVMQDLLVIQSTLTLSTYRENSPIEEYPAPQTYLIPANPQIPLEATLLPGGHDLGRPSHNNWIIKQLCTFAKDIAQLLSIGSAKFLCLSLIIRGIVLGVNK